MITRTIVLNKKIYLKTEKFGKRRKFHAKRTFL